MTSLTTAINRFSQASPSGMKAQVPMTATEAAEGVEDYLIPFHCMLEGLHGKVHLADVLVLHKDAQIHLAP